MDTASILFISFVSLTAAHVLAAVNGLVRDSDKLSRAPRRWNLPRALVGLAHTGLISVALVDAAKLCSKSIVLGGYPFQAIVVASALVGSFVSLASAIRGSVNIWQALYASLACVDWTLMWILLPAPGNLALVMAGLYLAALIATMSVPYVVPIWANQPHPLIKTALLPAITLSWLDPLVKEAASGEVTMSSLWPVTEGLSVQDVASDDKPGVSSRKWNLGGGLLSTVARYFTWPLCYSGLLALVNLLLTFAQPFLLQSLLLDQDPLAVAALFAASIISGGTQAHMSYSLQIIGLKTRSILTAYLCDQGLSPAQSANTDAPEPAVLIEVDLPRVYELIEQLHLIWMIPLQACISLGALIYILGWKSMLIGSVSPVVLMPILVLVMGKISELVTRVMEAKDSRVALVTQVLKQVRPIKMAALQTLFQDKIGQARDRELKRTEDVAISNAAMVCIVYLLPTTLVFICFGSYSYFRGRLTSVVVFPALAFFININRATSLLPRLVMLYKSGMISFNRVRNALSSTAPEKLQPISIASEAMAQAHVTMHKCSFGVSGNSPYSKLILQDCSMDLALGSLAVISGSVGSGKTTLLRSLLGDVTPCSGYVKVQGRVAYASQKPFLINGTVRENILFGSPFDGPFYEKVLDAVALRHDIMRLPEGDATVLGGTAVALSGGQMSRVALARAVYARREVVVVDDPLAAIDGQVRKHIIDQVLGPNGILKGSIRVVTTSAEALMGSADRLFVISHGTICETSVPQIGALQVSDSDTISTVAPLADDEIKQVQQPPVTIGNNYGSLKSTMKAQVLVAESGSDSENAPLLKKPQRTEASENPGRKGVSLETYLRFLRLSKFGGWGVVLVVAAASKLLDVLGLYFLKLSSEEFETIGHSNKLIYYAICGLLGAWLSAVFVLAAYLLCLLPASRRIHNDLTKGVLKSKFTFFDNTPLGQILSRFTNDINKVDGQVSGGFISLTAIGISALSSLLVIVMTSFLSIVYLVPIGTTYFIIQSYYLHARRQLRRIENDARGPILNIAGEIQTGSAVILSYGQSRIFKQRARSTIDNHVKVGGPFLALDIWLMLRLQLLSGIIQLLSANLLLAINAPPSTLGLVMNFIIQITVQFNTLVQTRANLEADITSVERVWSYAANPPEEDSTNETVPASSWPQTSSIVFDSFTACYVPGGAACLSNINLAIEPGQHIAVVGRTGAGKSSFTMALLRALDQRAIKSGQIRIDGLDISQVNLTTLRRAITLVPQEPAAFDGTMRYNLDPEEKLDDKELLDLAEICHVRRIFNMDDSTDLLEYPICSGSVSLSAGQIQIIALARAILARNKIVILDEAAAAMDVETRNVANDLIRRRFKDCTVIAITHHLDSVMNYDKVLVLDSGRVADYDEPRSLLRNEDSTFTQLMKQARSSHQAAS
ncbi:Canalicular multispecific organic anion transporter 2 [Fusarium sp. LHS14.1]|nr:Canalicular multispecific organic anion transporter 2 [Fusarium sp. LHS14.1]